jgi:[acyl-carrier-protein] S-malonyltransferase
MQLKEEIRKGRMKIGMVFPGYGSQFVGMGKELYDQSRVMQEYFEQAANCLDQNFVKLCFASSDAELSRMENAYPATFLVSCAFYGLLQEKGIIPDVVAGYNQGEYAALFASRSINFPDGLYLLSKLATLFEDYKQKNSFGLLQVEPISSDNIHTLCQQAGAEIAAYNSEFSYTISGPMEAITVIREHCIDLEACTSKHIGVEFGFHSDGMEFVTKAFKIYLEKVDFKDPQVTFVGMTTGKPVVTGEQIKSDIIEQLMVPLQWEKALHQFRNCDVIIEVGPGTTLGKWIKEKYPNKMILPLNTPADFEAIKSNVIVKTETKENV